MKQKSSLVLSWLLGLALVAPAAAFAATREMPMPVRTVTPAYPTELRTQRVAGLVLVKCAVDTQGNVTTADVVKSSHPGFERNAVEALLKWKFKPATEDGKPVAVSVTVPVKFNVDDAG